MLETFKDILKKMKDTIVPNKEDVSKNLAKQRLRIVLLQDRTNVSADFISLMKQEIIEVIKKYVVVDESTIDVNMTNSVSKDGKTTESGLSVKIPIIDIRNEMNKTKITEEKATKEEVLDKKKEEALQNSSNYLTQTNEELKNPVVAELFKNNKDKKSLKTEEETDDLNNKEDKDIVVTDITQVLEKLPDSKKELDVATETIVISTQDVVKKLISEEKEKKSDLSTTSEIEILIGDTEDLK